MTDLVMGNSLSPLKGGVTNAVQKSRNLRMACRNLHNRQDLLLLVASSQIARSRQLIGIADHNAERAWHLEDST